MYLKIIKRQSILTGAASISTLLFALAQMMRDEGSIFNLIGIICNVFFVYLSFSFKLRCFDLCCHKCMANCTCIEDRIEAKLAKKLRLKAKIDVVPPIPEDNTLFPGAM